MADLYSVIPGIQPDQQDILEAELLAKQILEANFPDLDLREGTALRDLTLRPSAFLLALCKKSFDYYFDQRTISNLDDTSSSETVDSILGNLFLARRLGTQAVINVRLYFARQKAVSLTSSTSFSTDGVSLFFPAASTIYPATALQYDSYQNEYFIDVDLVAEDKGVQYNIGSGSLLYFSNFDPFFLHGEINYLAQASTSPETNSEFISRASTAISTRNLINKPSIDARIKEDLNYVSTVVTIGAGDDEMYRDQVEVNGSRSTGRTGTALALADSNTTALVTLNNHGTIVGQLVDITEVDEPGQPKLVIKRRPVSTVVSSSQFKVVLPVSVAPRTFRAPNVVLVEEDSYLHQGGMADIHCSRAVTETSVQLTLDGRGQVTIEGPYIEVTRPSIPPVTDTITPFAPYYVESGIHENRYDINIVQNSDRTLSITCDGHCFVKGRMINLRGWPAQLSNLYLMVDEVQDEDTILVGRNLPAYTVESNLNPYIVFVSPRKDVGFSTRQKLTIDFGVPEANKVATVNLTQFENLDFIQEYLEVPNNRVVSMDLLARGFDVFFLNFDITVYQATAPSLASLREWIDGYLNSLSPGAPFIMGDLISALNKNGLEKLKTPITVTYRHFTKDLLGVQSGTVTDTLSPQNSVTVFLSGTIEVDTAELTT